jgi:YHS domain-containing protein
MATDLVCGMTVDEKTAKWVSEYKGRKYYFCSKHCQMEFEKEPEKYISNRNE